jgi:predicted outer membrane repeat protein
LLKLPNASTQKISFVDCLFMATSATSITGLQCIDAGEILTPFGQGILLVLLQIGGLGVMTFTCFIAYFFKDTSSFKADAMLGNMVGSEGMVSALKMILTIVIYTFTIEIGGAIAIFDAGTELLVSSSTFAGNSSEQHGGAVYVHGAYALFVNTTFSGNTSGSLGGGILETGGAHIDLLNCTFTSNQSKNGCSLHSADSRAVVRAVNCIFADDKNHQYWGAVSMTGGTLSTDWSSMDADPAKVFTASGNAVTQVVAGVTHVIHPPRGGADAGNEDAAEIYHDSGYSHVLAVGRDGTRVPLAGDANQATIPFVVDQLAQVRTAPTRGAVRLATGTEPVVVEIDGVLTDENGYAKEGTTLEAPATIIYSDGTVASTNLVVRTAEAGVFGLSVPVDGSDGLSHNVTGINIPALGSDTIEVTMAPYALKAASVDLIASPDYIELEGDDISIGNVAAGSIAAAKSFDARNAGSFTAGSLKGFREINLESVSVSGGSLKWLGGSGPASGVAFANLGAMSVGGGVQTSVSSSLSCGAGGTQSFDVGEAENDGLFQLQARCRNPNGGQLQIDVVEGGNVAFNVTPKGTVGPDGTDRRLVWTIPVRKGQKIRLTMYGGSSAFELSSVRGQFIYFGVAE